MTTETTDSSTPSQIEDSKGQQDPELTSEQALQTSASSLDPPPKMRKWLILCGVVTLLFMLVNNMLFTINETETGVLTSFGEPVRSLSEPGLYFKYPDPFQSVHRFDARLMVLDVRPAEVLTQDKKPLVYEAYACWKIVDPVLFLRTVKEKKGAEIRLNSLVRSEMNAALGKAELSSLLSIEHVVDIDIISDQVTLTTRKKTMENFGIDMLQVRLRRISFPEATRNSHFRRMRSERQRIAKKYRAEGEEEASKIRSDTDLEVSKLISKAYSEAEKTKGEGDAEAARIYAEAYSLNPELYQLTRTLEAYRKFLDDKTILVLDSNSEPLKLLMTGKIK